MVRKPAQRLTPRTNCAGITNGFDFRLPVSGTGYHKRKINQQPDLLHSAITKYGIVFNLLRGACGIEFYPIRGKIFQVVSDRGEGDDLSLPK